MLSASHYSSNPAGTSKVFALELTSKQGNDDLSLPKATVQKIITEILAGDSGVAFAKDTRDLLIECCVEFITMISSQANDLAEKDAKKTIACEHVKTALEELGFSEYVDGILEVANDYKKQQAVSITCS